MLDQDLAERYGVSTKALNQAVRRNKNRFPQDFMFQLNWEDTTELLRSQFVTLKQGRHYKYRPFAFTEHGALMLANVLNSVRAIQVSIFVVRTFIRLRQEVSTQREFLQRLLEFERKVSGHDAEIKAIFEALRQMMVSPQSEGMVGSSD